MARTNPYRACEDFHRTQRAAPAVSRRHFLRLGATAGLSLYAAQSLPLRGLLERAAEAHAAAPAAPILVTVFLPGGLDLLDAFVPLDQYGAYRGHRGALAQPEATTPRLGGTGLGVHPALTKGDGEGVKGLFERGRIGLLPGIDYADPDLSHFHSRQFWETGVIAPSASTGWLGRWLDRHGGRDNPFQGLTSGHRLSPVLRAASAAVASVEGVGASELTVSGVSGPAFERVMTAWAELGHPRTKDSPGQAAARRAARQALDVAVQLRGLQGQAPAQETQGGIELPGLGGGETGGYPRNSGFADRLRQLAFLLSQPLGTRVATVDADGDFDTHHGQGPALERELGEVSAALAAFQADLEARGLGERVLTLVWSEFGRRPKANESAGTDHGAGGIGWVQGVRAASGVLTEYPSLGALDGRGNLRVTVDFRQVYASLLEQWLGTDAGEVISDAGAFTRLELVR